MIYEEKKAKANYFKSVQTERQEQLWLIKELEKAWAALEVYTDPHPVMVEEDKWEDGKYVGTHDVRYYMSNDDGKAAREALGDE